MTGRWRHITAGLCRRRTSIFLKGGQLWIERDVQVLHMAGLIRTYRFGHSAQALVWDRNLLDMAWKMQSEGRKCKLGRYRDIFVGHTTTELFNTLQPIHVCNVWNIDTGAGWSGKLTIMDVDTKEYWRIRFDSGLIRRNA